MHPWHDPHVDESAIETSFPVIVEIPKGSTNKYELDKETGLLRLDRVLYSAVHIPPTTASSRAPIATMAIRSTCWCSVRSQYFR
jgi:hypothetical protein